MPAEIQLETIVNLVRAFGSTTALPTTSGPGGSSTAVVTRVAANAASVTLLAANTARRGATIFNSSPAAANLFIKFGTTANIGAGTESYTVRIPPNGYYEVPFGYTGKIDGIWDAADANGEALMTELTA